MNRQILVDRESDAVRAARKIGGPVVLKLISSDIVHKSDIGGVKLGLTQEEEIRSSFRKLGNVAAERGVRNWGISVQEMVIGVAEMIVGMKTDATFGPIVLVGMGGTLVEILQDIAIGVPPLSRSEIAGMIDGLRCAELLRGYRRRAMADRDALIEIVSTVSNLTPNWTALKELDLNPVIVRETGKGAVIVDARASVSE